MTQKDRPAVDRRRPIDGLLRTGLGLLGVVFAVVVWQVAAQVLAGAGGRISVLAAPGAVARRLVTYASGDLLADVLASLEVFAAGWFVGGVAATVTGLLLGRVRLLRRMFYPVIEALRPVSSIAWVPLSVVWFGLGYGSKVFLVALAVYLVVIVYAVDGSSRIAPELERTARMLGMGSWRRSRSLVLPSTMSEVVIGLRVALMAGWGTVIVAELVAANSGLGRRLIASQQSYDVESVMAAMLCFAAVGFLLNAAFNLVQARLVPWQRTAS